MRLGGEEVRLVMAFEELAPGMSVYLYPCPQHGRAERVTVTKIVTDDGVFSVDSAHFVSAENEPYAEFKPPIPGHDLAVVIGRQMVDMGFVFRVVDDQSESEITTARRRELVGV